MIVKTRKDMAYVKSNFAQVQNKLLNKNSKAESHFEKLLIDSGVYFRREKGNYRYQTRWSYYDFYIPELLLYIEIDGHSHDNEEQKTIDKEKEKIVRNKHRYIIRFTNDEVMKMDSMTTDELITALVKQQILWRKSLCKRTNSRKKKFQPDVIRAQYEKNLMSRRMQGHMDILDDANFDIELDKQIWLYDNAIGNYFRFNNIVEAKFAIDMSVNEIHNLCEMATYKPCNTRRFVFAYTKSDCELRVLQVYG